MADKIRTTPKIRSMIDSLSLPELQFFANLGASKDFPAFKEFIRKMIDYEKEYFFTLPEEDEKKLAREKAHARGKVAALTEMVYIIIGSVTELERRLKKE